MFLYKILCIDPIKTLKAKLKIVKNSKVKNSNNYQLLSTYDKSDTV